MSLRIDQWGRLVSFCAVVAAGPGCDGTPPGVDAGPPDAGAHDAGMPSPVDSGPPPEELVVELVTSPDDDSAVGATVRVEQAGRSRTATADGDGRARFEIAWAAGGIHVTVDRAHEHTTVAALGRTGHASHPIVDGVLRIDLEPPLPEAAAELLVAPLERLDFRNTTVVRADRAINSYMMPDGRHRLVLPSRSFRVVAFELSGGSFLRGMVHDFVDAPDGEDIVLDWTAASMPVEEATVSFEISGAPTDAEPFVEVMTARGRDTWPLPVSRTQRGVGPDGFGLSVRYPPPAPGAELVTCYGWRHRDGDRGTAASRACFRGAPSAGRLPRPSLAPVQLVRPMPNRDQPWRDPIEIRRPDGLGDADVRVLIGYPRRWVVHVNPTHTAITLPTPPHDFLTEPRGFTVQACVRGTTVRCELSSYSFGAGLLP